MDLRQLRFFLEVAQSGGFTRAADKLNTAQSAVSLAIKKLEDELEVKLFDRRDRRVSLTVEGETLVKNAKDIFRRVAQARQEIADLRGLLSGEVQVGLTPVLSSFFFPKIISTFKRQFPALKISVTGDSASNIQRKIESGTLDIGILEGKISEQLDSHHLLREEVVACVHRYHPFAKKKTCTTRELLAEPLVQFQKGYYIREIIDELAVKEGLVPTVMAESNLLSLVNSMVKEELGLAFMLKMAVGNDPDIVKVSCDPPIYLDLAIAWKKQSPLSPANRAFVNFLVREVDDYYMLAQAASTFPLP
jgi:DNA-binding transcriptional LysR family regulator